MQVTGIEELSKSRCKVFLDEQFAFALYKGELRLYHVCEGQELAEEDYAAIMGEVLPKRAKLRTMNLLAKKQYTVKQLRDKLQAGGYPQEIIEIALDYVAQYHYTDDLRYAIDYMNTYESTKSRRRMEQELLQKGIDREILEKAWREWEEKGGSQDEASMIRRLLEKRGYDPQCADIKEKQRMYGFLLRRGFASEQIRRALLSETE